MREEPGAGTPGRLGASALLLLTLALFFLPALTGTDQFLSRDTGSLHHPTKSWVASRWAAGHVPEWNPLAGLGMPEIAGAVDAVLHPFNVLLVALPFEAGFKAWVLLSYVAAAFGAFVWGRRLGCGPAGAVVGALAFALSGHLVGSSDNLQYLTTLAFLPWIFAAGHRFQEADGPGALAGVGLASALVAAGGDPQAWGFAILLLGPYLVAIVPPAGTARRRVARAALAVAVSVVAAAPFVLPVILWIPHSSRSVAVDAVRLSHWDLMPRRLVELVVPNLLRTPPGTMTSSTFDVFTSGGRAGLPWVASIYLGTTTLLLALAGIRLSATARRLGLVAVVFTWMSCGHFLGFSALASRLPVIGSFRYWEKLFIWPTLLVSMAAAIGLDRLLRADARVVRRFAATAAATAVVLLSLRIGGDAARHALLRALVAGDPSRSAGAAGLIGNALDGLGSSGLAAALLAVVAFASTAPRLARIAPALFVLAAVVDPFSANGHAYLLLPPAVVNPSAPLAGAMRPQGGIPRVFTPYEITSRRWPDRTEVEAGWMWGARTLRPAWNVQYGVGNFDAYAGMIPAELSGLRQSLRAADLAHCVGTWGFTAVVVPQAPDLAAMLELPPPFVVLGSDPELPAFLVALPGRPRAYLASSVQAFEPGRSRDALLSLDPTSRDVVVEGPVDPDMGKPEGRVEVTLDEPERVTLRVESDRMALVVLSDQFAPGWTARLDGSVVPIVKTNLLARGVVVGAGTHSVEFRYRTPGLGVGLAAVALLVAGLAAWGGLRRTRGSRPGRALPETCSE